MAPAAGSQGLSIAPAAGSQGGPWRRLLAAAGGCRGLPGVPGGSTGHRGSLAAAAGGWWGTGRGGSLAAAPATGGPWRWWLRAARLPPGSLDSLCRDCLLFGQLLRVWATAVAAHFLGNCCALGQPLPTFWATRGFWLPAARTGAGGRPEPRARWEGPYGTRGGRVAAAAAAAGSAVEPAAAAEAAAEPLGRRWAAAGPPLGRCGAPWAALGRRWAAAGPPLGRCRAPWAAGPPLGRCGAPWAPWAALGRCGARWAAAGPLRSALGTVGASVSNGAGLA